MNTRHTLVAVAALTMLATAACESTTLNGGDGGGGAGGSAGGSPVHYDLFACGLDIPCGPVTIHTQFEPPAALACQANRVIDDTPGAMLLNERPGPGTHQSDELTLLLGNGAAILQQRSRSTNAVGTDFSPWEIVSTELCQVDVPPELAAACTNANDPKCSWTSWDLDNCTPVIVTDCDGTVLQGEPGPS